MQYFYLANELTRHLTNVDDVMRPNPYAFKIFQTEGPKV